MSALKKIRPVFQIFWQYLNILKKKIKNKCKNKDDLDIFLNGPNFTRNGIIIPMLFIKAFFFKLLTRRYIFHLTKYEHKGTSESIIDFHDTNYSSVDLAK